METSDQTERKLGLIEEVKKLDEETEHLESVSSATALGISVDREKLFTACKQDMNILAGLALPEVFEFYFPPMFVVVWNWLKEYAHKPRDFSKLALGLPRGFAKTTLVKLFVLYCILFTNKKFALIISHTEKHGINIINDIMSMLKERNIISTFGDYSIGQERDTQSLQIFNFRGRKFILAAIGAEGSIRGLNLGNDRPDLMIFEDFQAKEESESEFLSTKLLNRMVGTIMKAKSPKGCLYLYVANMYPTPGSILKKLKENPFWIKFIIGGILADGTSLWEELQPLQQLLEELQNDTAMGTPEIFFAEVLNDETAGIRSGIDLNAIPICPYLPIMDSPQGKFITIDPAGSKDTNDFNAIGYTEVFDGRPVLQQIYKGHWSPLELIMRAIVLAIKTKTNLIVVEDVSYQQSLLFWFNHVCLEHGISGLMFEGINPESKSKVSRIKTMLRGLLSFNKEGIATQPEQYIGKDVRGFVLNEIVLWNPLSATNQDETLDILAYSGRIIQKYSDLFTVEFSLDTTHFDGAIVLPAYVTSPF